MAQRYRKKPVVIEAMQYTGRNGMAIGAWAEWPEISEDFMGGLDVPTLEGTMTASTGDWVIKDVKGEFYPCKPDIFEATYELVTEAADD